MSFTTAITRLSYNGDGSSVSFPVPWLFYANTDLLVIVGGGTQTLGAQFNVIGAGLGSGTVTFVTAPPIGVGNVQIILNDPLTQTANFVDGTAFPSNTLNQVNDRAVQISSRLYDLISRAVRAPDGDANPLMLLPTAAQRSNNGAGGLIQGYDAAGNVSLVSLLAAGTPISAAVIGGFLYPQSAAELTAGVVPTALQYAPGNLLRYGADPTGALGSDAAIAAALSCNADVFDGYPGGGTYLLNSGLTLVNFPVTIRGQARNNQDIHINTGTKWILGSAAGAGAAHITASYIDGLRISNVGFQWQVGNLTQYAIHIKAIGPVNGQMRSSTIENCAFVGTGFLDTNVAIKLDSSVVASEYSAFNTIRECYFSHVADGIWFTGNSTPNYIINNSFIGYTGIAGAVNGAAIELDYPVSETVMIGNYFEGWITGISSAGAVLLLQFGNEAQVCTQGYNWVAPVAGPNIGRIPNQSFGHRGVAGITSGATTTDGSQMQKAGSDGWLATGGAIGSTRGFQEGDGPGTNLRAAALGYGTTLAPTLAANGGGSLSAVVTNTFSYSRKGGEITILFNISATLTGAGTTAITMAIPAGVGNAIVAVLNPCVVLNNAATGFGIAYVTASGSVVNIGANAAGNLAFTAGAIGWQGQITFRTVS